MIDTGHIYVEDLALHAMRLLPTPEAAQADAHLAICRECREEFQRSLGDLAIVALTVELTAPGAKARERFVTQIAREKRVIPIDRSPVDRRSGVEERVAETGGKAARKPGGVLPWLGWAIAAGVVISTASLYRERGMLQATIADQSAQLQAETAQVASLSAEAVKARTLMEALTSTNAMRVTLNTTPGGKPLPQGRASYVASKGTLLFIANNLEPLPLDKVYELWIIPADGAGPVPAGTFHPDARGNASVVLPKIPTGVDAKAFGVTLEAEGGAAKPTLPILMVGQ